MIEDHGSTTVNSGAFRVLAWIGIVVQLAALGFVLWSERWSGLPSIGIMLALSIIFMLNKEHVPSLVSLLVVVAAIVNAGGWAWNWFNQFVWYDEFVHLFTSFAVISAVACSAFGRGWLNADPGSGKFVFWVTAVGLGVGILWEVAEWMFISIGWTDTLLDLLLDTIGAAAAAGFASWVLKRQSWLSSASPARVRAGLAPK